MGSSAIRGLAFGKPTVILGEQGFSEVFEPATQARFLDAGYYGIGPGRSNGSGARDLADHIERLCSDPGAPARAVATRELMVERYGIPAVAQRLDAIYQEVAVPVRRGKAVRGALRHLPAAVVSQLPDGLKDRLRRALPSTPGLATVRTRP
jgi:hypothetical protein